MSFSTYKHGISTDQVTPTGDAGLAINNNFITIGNLFDGVFNSSGGTITGNLSINGSINLNSGGKIVSDGAGGIILQDDGGDTCLQVASGLKAYTQNNTLDDGGGNVLLSGNVFIGGTITGSETLTIIKGCSFNGGNYILQNGLIGSVQIPFNANITGWTVISTDDTSGSISIDVQTSTYSSFTPNSAGTSIVGSGTKPNLTSQVKNQVTSISGWTSTQLTAGQYLICQTSGTTSVKNIRIELTLTPR